MKLGMLVLLLSSVAMVISCTPKQGAKAGKDTPTGDLVLGGKAPCAIPVVLKPKNPNDQPKIVGEPFEIQFGYESEEQKKTWNKKGFPKAQLVHRGNIVPIPVKGLAGDLINPIGGKIKGNICKGVIGVMDAVQRVWMVFNQGDLNKVVMMAYDPRQKKFVTGNAPQSDIYSLSYEKGNLLYLTANKVTEPGKAFIKKSGKDIPVRELTLPYWVRLDLSGKTRAFVDANRTFASSAFRPLFDKPEKFHEFFARNDKGLYDKQWAYVANVGEETCVMARTERGSGDLSSEKMHCKKLPKPTAQRAQPSKKPASTK